MKKNKTVAYMLAATLLVGGTFAGTKAWFSDQVATDNGIKITMGTLDLELKENGASEEGENLGWELVRVPENTDNESTTGKDKPRNGEFGSEFAEIRPGDTFKRTFTIKNNGTLDQIVLISNTKQEDLGEYANLFTLNTDGEVDFVNEKEFRLDAGVEKTLTLTLTPDEEKINNTYNAESEQYGGENIFNLEDILGDIEVTGRQINNNQITQ